jgi:ABC-2 type transport system permease protein
MMNIYLHELKTRLKSVLIWSASIVALMFFFMSLFQSFANQTALVTSLMASFPKELLIAFGMADMDWSTILGFYALLFVFIQICLAVQAANYGFALVSIEETEWTADFLLSKPVSRGRIYFAKLLAALTALALTQALIWAFSLLVVALFNNGQAVDFGTLALLLLSMIPFQLFFLSVGLLISLLVKRIRSVTPFSMGLVFGLYILNAFGGMIGEKSLEVISPFQHFAPNFIIKHAAWDGSLAWISLVIIVIAFPASYILYQRRNIPSAV